MAYPDNMVYPDMVHLEPDEDIARRFYALCERRRVEPEKMFETMVRSFDRGPVLYQAYDRVDFGKYSGMILDDIIKTDPRYVRWLTRESAWFRISETAELLLREAENA